MSQENVELVQRWYERLNAGDPGAELCSEDVEIKNWAESPVPGPYHGPDGLHRWFRDVNDSDIGTDIQMFCLEELIEVDEERVVTVQRARGRARYTQIEMDHLWGAVIGIRDGKIASATGYATPVDAKQAAGLAE